MGFRSWLNILPLASTHPTATFVPPISTPITGPCRFESSVMEFWLCRIPEDYDLKGSSVQNQRDDEKMFCAGCDGSVAKV
jgi:hypothetical protein